MTNSKLRPAVYNGHYFDVPFSTFRVQRNLWIFGFQVWLLYTAYQRVKLKNIKFPIARNVLQAAAREGPIKDSQNNYFNNFTSWIFSA